MADRIEPGLEQFPLAKQTVPGAVAYGWFAVIGKKGINRNILTKLNQDMNEVLNSAETQSKSRELGVTTRPGTPEQLNQWIVEDQKAWQTVLTKLKYQPE
jgi:tripartite-type tricarboxylate transporter receptor subunit TctC